MGLWPLWRSLPYAALVRVPPLPLQQAESWRMPLGVPGALPGRAPADPHAVPLS